MAGGGGGGGGEGEGETELTLEFTPTWIVAVVCSVIVLISLFFERILHYLGKFLKRKKQKPLFDALQKVKEELMLLGFISLLLTVFQGSIQRICIKESLTHHMLPCSLKDKEKAATTAHYAAEFFAGALGSGRRLLAGGGGDSTHCQKKGKAPLLSLEAIHQLHIFIFVLAVTHVVLSLITVVIGSLKIQRWKHWEDSIPKEAGNGAVHKKITHVRQFEFIGKRFKGFDKDSSILSWLHSFVKQFFHSVTKTDYTTMRLGFVMTHFKCNSNFNFYKYMVRALEDDFKRVVGISWYLWIFVMVFLLLDVHGWHAYFWISFIPLLLLLAVGTKLEHIITQLAHEVAEKHTAIEGDLVVTPSNALFWFHRPEIVLVLIHFILFQNAFEIAFFFWILTTYHFDSCIMGKAGFIIPRLVVSVIIQLLCSYSTLPLYAIVTQMGSSFKKAIFDEHVQQGLLGWAGKIKDRKGKRVINTQSVSNTQEPRNGTSVGIQLQNVEVQKDSIMEEAQGEIVDEEKDSKTLLKPRP